MSFDTGTIIIGEPSGKPVPDAAFKSDNRAAHGTVNDQIIRGYDHEEPATERIAGSDSGTEPRRNADGSISKRRGRKPGSTNTKKEQVPVDAIDLQDVIFQIGIMGAGLTKFMVPELKDLPLEFETDETEKLAKAIKTFGHYHNIGFDPKKVAAWNLAAALGSVVGTRILLIYNTISNRPKPTPIQAVPKTTQAAPMNQQTQTAPKVNGLHSPSDVFGPQSGDL